MPSRAPLPFLVTALVSLVLAGCAAPQAQSGLEYPMGQKVTLGPLTYNVIESAWRNQLGDALRVRIPDQRFLVLTLSVTNGGGRQVSVPLLSLQNQNGQTFSESEDGEGLDNWFGLLRNIDPAQTQQGIILFDVALTSYRLRITDGGEPGADRFAWVQIPLRIDADDGIDVPVPGLQPK
jgi:hypothetical protein